MQRKPCLGRLETLLMALPLAMTGCSPASWVPALDLWTRVRLHSGRERPSAGLAWVAGAAATWQSRKRGEEESRWIYRGAPEPGDLQTGDSSAPGVWWVAGQTGPDPDTNDGQSASSTEELREATP
ncbi:MAG: hypothetical protein OXU20_01630 [Myxococcales bacterium]|nr:hypothetical protein [Myxococcales bacterium]